MADGQEKPTPSWRNCNECEHLNDHGTWCRKWEAVPPEEFKPKGCDQWEDRIPF